MYAPALPALKKVPSLSAPLHPKVFVAFSVPAIVLATQWCSHQSDRVWNRLSGSAVACADMCYLVLSLRPLATAAVYFSDAQCMFLTWALL